MLLPAFILVLLCFTSKLSAQTCTCTTGSIAAIVNCRGQINKDAFTSTNLPNCINVDASEWQLNVDSQILNIDSSYDASSIKGIKEMIIKESKLNIFNLTAFFDGLKISRNNFIQLIIEKDEQLTVLKKGSITHFPHLKTITFTQSYLESIEEGAFDSLEALKSLDLQSNKLKSLPTVLVLGSKPELDDLKLQGNKLQSIPDLVFSGICEVKSKTYCTIDLSNNELKKLNNPAPFKNVQIRDLRLVDNLLTSFSPEILTSSNGSITNLNLKKNKLTTFETRFNIIPENVDLEDNQWNCSVNLYRNVRNLKSSGTSVKLICSTPANYTDKSLLALASELKWDEDISDINQQTLKPNQDTSKSVVILAVVVSAIAVIICLVVIVVLFLLRNKICLPKKKPGQGIPIDDANQSQHKDVKFSALKPNDGSSQVKVV